MNRPIIVVDIDGTVADAQERADKYLGNPKDWDSFYDSCREDKPIMPIVRLVNSLAQHYKIVFCSGRRESCRNDTTEWIMANMDINQPVVMLLRKDKDFRHDSDVKPELLKSYLDNDGIGEYVLGILEDRNSMVSKWRNLGYACLQVADGNF